MQSPYSIFKISYINSLEEYLLIISWLLFLFWREYFEEISNKSMSLIFVFNSCSLYNLVQSFKYDDLIFLNCSWLEICFNNLFNV